MNRTDQNLKDAIAANEKKALWGAAAVIFGLVLEVIFAAAFHEPPETLLNHWGPVAADAIVALGVAAEVLFGRKSRIDSEELTRRSEERLAEATVRAAEAQRETERLRAENLIMQAGLRPRRITMPSGGPGEPRAEEFENAAKYAGTLALIQCVPRDFEAETLAQDISLVLSDCGWKPTILNEPDWLVSPRMITEGVRVVTIEESPFSDDGIRKPNPPVLSDAGRAADALVAMLERGLGRHEDPPSFAAYRSPEYAGIPFLFHGKSTPPKDAVVVLVGMRPLTFSLPPFSTSKYP
jgi:hypothetical protein